METKTVTRFLGTCQICEQEQKLHSNKLVHHGYKRPGHGSIEGDCYGVYAVPYELSCDLVKKYLILVENDRKDTEARLLALQSGTVTTLSRKTFSGRFITTIVGDVDWSRELESAINDTKFKISCIKREIARLEARVVAWKLTVVRTIEEREAEEKTAKDARAAERAAARQVRADKAAATKAKGEALQAKREAIMLDFKNRFIALAEGPESNPESSTFLAVRKELAQGIAREMSLKKYSFFYARDLKCDETFITLGLAFRASGWVTYLYPLA